MTDAAAKSLVGVTLFRNGIALAGELSSSGL